MYGPSVRVWVDIDNPPQVQYLVPLGRAFERAGCEVVFTARDYGITYSLLRGNEIAFHPVGSQFAKSRVAKVRGLVHRTYSLISLFRRLGKPDVLVSASRPSATAARLMRVPTFILCDYEYVDLRIYRWLRSNLLFPAAIDTSFFTSLGFGEGRLTPFTGLKEDITFADVVLDDVTPYVLPGVAADHVKVLFRPPAEESHYHHQSSSVIANELLQVLAADERIIVIYSPRYDWQLERVLELDWHNPPVLLREAVPFLELLTAVDLVVSAGGTMLREAAYLGVPAFSLFQGPAGAVDTHLESIGRLRFVRSSNDFATITLERPRRKPVLRSNPQLAGALVDSIVSQLDPGARVL